MSPQALYYLILAIIIAGFVFDQWINYLNTTMRSNTLPEALKGFYDESTYSLQQDYERDNYRFGLVSDILSFLTILAMLILGGFAWIDGFVRNYTDSAILLAIFFFGVIAFASDLLNIPLEVYHYTQNICY
jgi:STE24 endopeptidase